MSFIKHPTCIETIAKTIDVVIMGVLITTAISYFSGHILDELVVTILLGYICGYILSSINEIKIMMANIEVM